MLIRASTWAIGLLLLQRLSFSLWHHFLWVSEPQLSAILSRAVSGASTRLLFVSTMCPFWIISSRMMWTRSRLNMIWWRLRVKETHTHTWHLRIRQEVLTHRHGNRQQMRKDTSSSLCGDKQRHSDQTGGRTGQQTWCSDDQVHPNSPPGWSIYPKPPRSYEPARRRTARSEETNFIWVFPFYATFNL